MTLPASNETIVWQISLISHYTADGKVDEEIAETDVMPLFVSLGLMPPMGE